MITSHTFFKCHISHFLTHVLLVLKTIHSLHVKHSIRKLFLQNYSLKSKHKLWRSQRAVRRPAVSSLGLWWGSNPWQAACRNEKLIYVTLLQSHSHHGMKRQREEQQKLHEGAQLKWRTKDKTQLPVDKYDTKKKSLQRTHWETKHAFSSTKMLPSCSGKLSARISSADASPWAETDRRTVRGNLLDWATDR